MDPSLQPKPEQLNLLLTPNQPLHPQSLAQYLTQHQSGKPPSVYKQNDRQLRRVALNQAEQMPLERPPIPQVSDPLQPLELTPTPLSELPPFQPTWQTPAQMWNDLSASQQAEITARLERMLKVHRRMAAASSSTSTSTSTTKPPTSDLHPSRASPKQLQEYLQKTHRQHLQEVHNQNLLLSTLAVTPVSAGVRKALGLSQMPPHPHQDRLFSLLHEMAGLPAR